jgi:hypothetical protein
MLICVVSNSLVCSSQGALLEIKIEDRQSDCTSGEECSLTFVESAQRRLTCRDVPNGRISYTALAERRLG